MTKSGIINEALVRHLDPAPVKEHGQEVLERLRGLAKKLRQLDREVQVLSEMLALFVRYFLTINPPLPRPAERRRDARTPAYAVFVGRLRGASPQAAPDLRCLGTIVTTIKSCRPRSPRRNVTSARTTRQSGDDGKRVLKPLEEVAHIERLNKGHRKCHGVPSHWGHIGHAAPGVALRSGCTRSHQLSD